MPSSELKLSVSAKLPYWALAILRKLHFQNVVKEPLNSSLLVELLTLISSGGAHIAVSITPQMQQLLGLVDLTFADSIEATPAISQEELSQAAATSFANAAIGQAAITDLQHIFLGPVLPHIQQAQTQVNTLNFTPEFMSTFLALLSTTSIAAAAVPPGEHPSDQEVAAFSAPPHSAAAASAAVVEPSVAPIGADNTEGEGAPDADSNPPYVALCASLNPAPSAQTSQVPVEILQPNDSAPLVGTATVAEVDTHLVL